MSNELTIAIASVSVSCAALDEGADAVEEYRGRRVGSAEPRRWLLPDQLEDADDLRQHVPPRAPERERRGQDGRLHLQEVSPAERAARRPPAPWTYGRPPAEACDCRFRLHAIWFRCRLLGSTLLRPDGGRSRADHERWSRHAGSLRLVGVRDVGEATDFAGEREQVVGGTMSCGSCASSSRMARMRAASRTYWLMLMPWASAALLIAV